MGQLASVQMKLEPTAAIGVLTIEPARHCVISSNVMGGLQNLTGVFFLQSRCLDTSLLHKKQTIRDNLNHKVCDSEIKQHGTKLLESKLFILT